MATDKKPKPKGKPKPKPRGRPPKAKPDSEALDGELLPNKRPKAENNITDLVTEAQMEALGTRQLGNETNAHYLGMSVNTFYEMLNRRPELRTAMRRGRAKVFAKVFNVVLDAALHGNIYAATQILRLKGGWRDPTLADYSDNDGEPREHIPGQPEEQTSGVLLLPQGIEDHAEWEKRSKEENERLQEVIHARRTATAPTTKEDHLDTAAGESKAVP